ncbi:MAG TPA: hypothetical protein VGS19_28815 [Streptosporangiaceae bacterium]|nr:hypothetical protein [Streptosporangiaceae bacterium]
MIEVESYLRTGDDEFTRIEEAREVPPDPRYVEGALTLSIGGRAVLDTVMWDYIDQLWAYVSDMVGSLSEKDEVSTYFPDQPIRLTFRRQANGRVLVSAELTRGPRVANADERELVTELQAKGEVFFARMSEFFPENRRAYEDALTRLRSYRR